MKTKAPRTINKKKNKLNKNEKRQYKALEKSLNARGYGIMPGKKREILDAMKSDKTEDGESYLDVFMETIEIENMQKDVGESVLRSVTNLLAIEDTIIKHESVAGLGSLSCLIEHALREKYIKSNPVLFTQGYGNKFFFNGHISDANNNPKMHIAAMIDMDNLEQERKFLHEMLDKELDHKLNHIKGVNEMVKEIRDKQ